MAVRGRQIGFLLAAVGPLLLVWIVAYSRTPAPPSDRLAARRAEEPGRTSPPELPAGDLFTLSGSVVDEEGRPIAGATVRLIDPEGRGDVIGPGKPREFRDREVRSGEAGDFRFAGLHPGRRSLLALAGDRAPAWTEPFLLDRSLERTLRLPSPVSVGGLTHPKARLWFACRLPGASAPGHEPFGRAVVADDGGSFRADGLPPSVSFTVRVEAPGYRSRTFGPYQFPPGRHLLDFDLETGLTLTGTVRDGAGRPVAGARVVFDDARGVSEADGSFRLAGLEERTTALVVSREGYIQTTLPSVRPGSLDVTLPRAAEVTGRVMDGRARYLCFTVGEARYRMGLGGADTFRLPSVPPGLLRLDIEDADCRLLGSVLVEAPEGGCVEGVEIHAR